jgi:hypothetical protein
VEYLVDWILLNSDWLGFPGMAIIGGTVGHIESVSPFTSARRCLWGLSIAWIKALFIAALFYQLSQAYGGNLAIWFFATGLASVFSSETIRTMYVYVKNRLIRKNG